VGENINMPQIDLPWPHFCVDGFMHPDKFSYHCGKAKKLGVPVGGYENIKREFLDYDPAPEIGEMINWFSEKRGYKSLKKLIHYAATPAKLNHPMHDEAEHKIMSAVLYLTPKENGGTVLYEPDETYSYDVEWKPNRLFVFCGKTDVTHHSYYSTDTRYTLNYFLVDPTKITDPRWKHKFI
jgi:hypothetical protein